MIIKKDTLLDFESVLRNVDAAATPALANLVVLPNETLFATDRYVMLANGLIQEDQQPIAYIPYGLFPLLRKYTKIYVDTDNNAVIAGDQTLNLPDINSVNYPLGSLKLMAGFQTTTETKPIADNLGIKLGYALPVLATLWKRWKKFPLEAVQVERNIWCCETGCYTVVFVA
jgi:hypothetical protein